MTDDLRLRLRELYLGYQAAASDDTLRGAQLRCARREQAMELCWKHLPAIFNQLENAERWRSLRKLALDHSAGLLILAQNLADEGDSAHWHWSVSEFGADNPLGEGGEFSTACDRAMLDEALR